MKKYLLFGLFIFIFSFSIVSADTYTNIGYLSDKSDIYVSVTYQTESNAPLPVYKDHVYNIPGIWGININIANYNFNANVVYEIELNIPYNSFNNNVNSIQVIGSNNSGCQYISNRQFDGHYPRVRFSCTNATNGLSIDISNTSHNNIVAGGDTFRWNYTYLILVNVSQDTTAIEQNNQIIHQNEIIIENQNNNTQEIIDNQNANTDKQIESQKVCTTIKVDKNDIRTDNHYLNSNGGENSNTNFGITDFIELSPTSKITLLRARAGSAVSYCFYNDNKEKISCDILGTNPQVGDTYTIPSGSKYVKFSINKNDNNPQYEITNSCVSGNQAITDSVNDLTDALTDDDISDSAQDGADFILDFDTNTFGLTSIITAPLNLINSLTSKTCTQLHLPLPYLSNKYLDLPCMTTIYSTYFGTFFTMYQTITYGIIAYWVCVRIFNQVKDFKNPEHDEIEVVDL